MPAIFIGHGSPMIAIEHNDFTAQWAAIGKRYQPKAILMISAHWYTDGNRTQNDPLPQKVNDMYGFPKSLYALEYKAKGDPQLTDAIQASLGNLVSIDPNWGLDHGAWSVLVHMYPKANVPVVQLSVDRSKSPMEQFELGQTIAHLRDQGYMVIASGNVVHNLGLINPTLPGAYPWAEAFDQFIEKAIISKDYEQCINYRDFGEAALQSVPSPDHYYPLLNLLGTVNDGDQLTVFNKGYAMGSLSMTSYLFDAA